MILWAVPDPLLHPIKHELPDAFADFFDNKIRQLRENIDTTSDDSDTDPFGHDNAFFGQSLAEFELVSEMEVRETILKRPPKSSNLTAEGNDR